MIPDKNNPIIDLTINFAIDAIAFAETLETHKKYIIANQFLKSGTSIGANVREAQNAESKADFIHKMKIAHKEADETSYWLELCRKADSYPVNAELEQKVLVIQKVLTKIIASSKQRS